MLEIRELDPLNDFAHGFFESLYNLTMEPIDIGKAVLRNEELRHNSYTTTFVAVESGTKEIIGTATIVIDLKFIHNCANSARIEDVAVKKGFEDQGVGKALIEKLISEAKKKNCYKITLTCKEVVQAFYEKSGFKKNDEICMRLDLL